MSSLYLPFYKLLMKDEVIKDIMFQINNIQIYSDWSNLNLGINVADIDLSTLSYEDITQQVNLWRSISKVSVDLWRDYDYYKHFIFEAQFTSKEYTHRLEVTGLVLDNGMWRCRLKPEEEVVQANVFMFCFYQLIFNKMKLEKPSYNKEKIASESNIIQEKEPSEQNYHRLNDSNTEEEKYLINDIKPCYVSLCKDICDIETFNDDVYENKEKISSINTEPGNKQRRNMMRTSKKLAMQSYISNCILKKKEVMSSINTEFGSEEKKNVARRSKELAIQTFIQNGILQKKETRSSINKEFRNEGKKNVVRRSKALAIQSYTSNGILQKKETISLINKELINEGRKNMMICKRCSKCNKSGSFQCKYCATTNDHKECLMDNISVTDAVIEEEEDNLSEINECQIILSRNTFKSEEIKPNFCETTEITPGDFIMYVNDEKENIISAPETSLLRYYQREESLESDTIQSSSLTPCRKRVEKQHNWKCHHCDAFNIYASDNCVICSRSYYNCTWICIICSRWNKSNSYECKWCGATNSHKECTDGGVLIAL